MGALVNCSKLFCQTSCLNQAKNGLVLSTREQGLVANLRRSYHQYKPKDRPSLHETTQSLDPLITRDVLLYRYEEPVKVFGKNIFAFSMFPLWAYLGYSAYNLKDDLDPFSENVNKPNFGILMSHVQKASFGVGLGFLLFGSGISAYWISRTLKTVRRLVLKKGGKHVNIVTYGLLGPYSRSTTIPIQQLSLIRQPDDARMFLRVRSHYFKYQLNLDGGVFGNRPLFDRTIGISRKI